MLSCVRRPLLAYELEVLAGEGSFVSVGRETDSHIQLDSSDVPCLLSRRHAQMIRVGPGEFTVVDLGSTNGTFAARQDQPLRKIPAGFPWELRHGDTVGFGGPETIIVRRAQVGNPFLFKFYSLEQQTPRDATLPATGAANPPLAHPLHISGRQAAANRPPADVRSSQDQDAKQPIAPLQHPRQDDDHMAVDDSPVYRVHASAQAHNKQQPAVGRAMLQPAPPHPAVPHGAPFSPAPGSKRMTDILSSHLSCPVCCDWLLASHTLPCGHMFCGLCLATWVTQNQSCPSCRKTITGMPVRCFQVDSTINDLLAVQQCMSPSTKRERVRKQEHWDNIHRLIVQDWATSLQRRKDAALSDAARHNQELQQGQAGAAPGSGGAASVAGAPAQAAGAALGMTQAHAEMQALLAAGPGLAAVAPAPPRGVGR